jgi:general secretion pathway protein L
MSLLAIKLPPRQRLGARAASGEPVSGLRLPVEWPFVLSADGRTAGPLSQAPLALLPRADRVVLVLSEGEVSWHAVAVPKAPPARMRAALAGVMEEVLLDDDEAVHLALAGDAVPGKTGWVAVTHGPRLTAALAALESGGLTVEQVVPAQVPSAAGAPVRGHFFAVQGDDNSAAWLALAREEGALSLRLDGALARSLLPAPGQAAQWTATPAAATAAEQWLGRAVPLQTDAEHLLECASSPVNLRQFELAVRHRGLRALRDVGKRLWSAEWRPVRVGVMALLALQLVGLNVHAWQQRQAVQAKRVAMNDLLRSTHPGVRAVLDAPAQMAGETERLRAAAGRPGGADLEVLLNAAAAAWPEAQGPTADLRFDAGRLVLSAAGWRDGEVQAFRNRLKSAGFGVEFAEGRLTVTRLPVSGVLS